MLSARYLVNRASQVKTVLAWAALASAPLGLTQLLLVYGLNRQLGVRARTRTRTSMQTSPYRTHTHAHACKQTRTSCSPTTRLFCSLTQTCLRYLFVLLPLDHSSGSLDLALSLLTPSRPLSSLSPSSVSFRFPGSFGFVLFRQIPDSLFAFGDSLILTVLGQAG
eukprot:6176440-Pleurochrysis_carterae.AAC.1